MFDWLSLLFGLVLGFLLAGLLALRMYARWQKQLSALNLEQARLKASEEQLQKALTAEKDLHSRLSGSFEQMAQRVLIEQSSRISAEQQNTLGQVLSPLKERLHLFEKTLSETYQKEARERFHLQKEIEQLVSLNQEMGEEARRLTHALKGDSKVQGNWGELVLERVLERSGLRAGEEYIVQARQLQLTDEEGKRFQPDVIIHLPDQKHLIIDSKVSLSAFERYSSTEHKAEAEADIKAHIYSIQNHIKQLSAKHYAQLNGLNAPDFVLMFVPIEGAFSLALQEQADLFSYAWDRKIVLVSPTTLLATLKTVASLWKLERQNANAEEIARQGGMLYDKLVGMVEELQKVGHSLERASSQYQETMNKLQYGKGNLIRRAEKLREMGLATKKKLPTNGKEG